MSDYKILVPLDGSRVAEYPLAYLKALKQLGTARVRLVSVAESFEHPGLDPEEQSCRELNLLLSYLRDVARDVEQHAGIQVDTQVITGEAAPRLIEITQQDTPDLLMVATHGRSGISRWRMGSVADKLVRAAHCKTLVIGPGAAENESWVDTEIVPAFQRILVPLDGSDLAHHAVAEAQRFAEACGSEIHLVTVVRIPVAPAGMEGVYAPNLLQDLVEAARTWLREAARDAGTKHVVKTEIRIGDAAGQLEDYIRGNGIDLVTMTSHGRGGVLRTALGSVTDRLLSTAAAPVLIVR